MKTRYFPNWKTIKLFQKRRFFSHILIGAVLGVVILHPATKLVYWLEIRGSLEGDKSNLKYFLLQHFHQSLSYDAWPTNLIFAMIGICISFILAYFNQKILKQSHKIQFMEDVLAVDTLSLIGAGESESLEFKSSVRWDVRRDCINKNLDAVITKSIAGFMNHLGGTLLIGVADNGDIIGIENDFKTIKKKTRDGFECLIMSLVESYLGRDCCTLVHCTFQTINKKDICRVSIESSKLPVYVKSDKISRYFVRTGNATRELDAREAHTHISQR